MRQDFSLNRKSHVPDSSLSVVAVRSVLSSYDSVSRSVTKLATEVLQLSAVKSTSSSSSFNVKSTLRGRFQLFFAPWSLYRTDLETVSFNFCSIRSRVCSYLSPVIWILFVFLRKDHA
jgi:hypothetical protein